MEPLERAADLARSGVGRGEGVVGALRGTAGDGTTRGLDDLPALVERFPGTAELSTRSAQPRDVEGTSATPSIGRCRNRSRMRHATPRVRAVRVAFGWEAERFR